MRQFLQETKAGIAVTRPRSAYLGGHAAEKWCVRSCETASWGSVQLGEVCMYISLIRGSRGMIQGHRRGNSSFAVYAAQLGRQRMYIPPDGEVYASRGVVRGRVTTFPTRSTPGPCAPTLHLHQHPRDALPLPSLAYLHRPTQIIQSQANRSAPSAPAHLPRLAPEQRRTPVVAAVVVVRAPCCPRRDLRTHASAERRPRRRRRVVGYQSVHASLGARACSYSGFLGAFDQAWTRRDAGAEMRDSMNVHESAKAAVSQNARSAHRSIRDRNERYYLVPLCAHAPREAKLPQP